MAFFCHCKHTEVAAPTPSEELPFLSSSPSINISCATRNICKGLCRVTVAEFIYGKIKGCYGEPSDQPGWLFTAPGHQTPRFIFWTLCKLDTSKFTQGWSPHSSNIYPNRENVNLFCCKCPIGYAMFFQLLDCYLAVVSEQFANLIVACIK